MKMQTRSETMMTYRQLADWWGVPIGTLYAWVAQGVIPHVRLGSRCVRFERDVVEAWLSKRRTPAPPSGRSPST
jgi:excisionase family DNA binding protein